MRVRGCTNRQIAFNKTPTPSFLPARLRAGERAVVHISIGGLTAFYSSVQVARIRREHIAYMRLSG